MAKINEIAIMDFKSLPEYQGARERQQTLVRENPFIKIENHATYTEAKKRRTALASGRYELQNGQKTINAKIKEFKAMVDKETLQLIEITKPYEDQQQEEVKRYEAEKQREKEEKARREQERIQKHRDAIKAFKEEKEQAIESASIETIDAILEDINSSKLDVDEFQNHFFDVLAVVMKAGRLKKSQLEEAEKLRLQKEEAEAERKKLEAERKKLEAEMEEAKRIAEAEERKRKEAEEKKLRLDKAGEARREMLFEIGVLLDFATCRAMDEETWSSFYREKNDKYQAEQNRIYLEKKKAEREQKEEEKAIKAEKEEAERKAKEEAERKRQEALKPDKQKAIEAISKIDTFPELELKDAEVQAAYQKVVSNISDLIKHSIDYINEI